MSKVVKYYYTSPILKATISINPILNKTVISNPKQGKRYTIAAIFDDEEKTIKFGLATCQPIDNFCKATGRQIAVHNANNRPFHIIENFTGRRNDFADEVMKVMADKEVKLLKHDNPNLFNVNCFVEK